MNDAELLIGLVSVMVFSLSLFSASMLLVQLKSRLFVAPLALFFLVTALSEIPNIALIVQKSVGVSDDALGLLGAIGVVLPPLYWLYVRAITSLKEPYFFRSDWLHFIPLILALLSLALFIRFVQIHPEFELSGELESLDLISIITLGIVIVVFTVVPILQYSIYLYLIVARMVRYRARLRQRFSSTEKRELSWIVWIAVSLVIYWLLNIGGPLVLVIWHSASDQSDLVLASENSVIPELTNLGLVWALSLWALRQPRTFEEIGAENGDLGPEKYARSALSEEKLAAICKKLDRAMREHSSHKDPNLSLRDLAKQVGELPNYVSQALNTKMECSFFDYVNRWRIEDAKKLIAQENRPIVEIAFETGFNSRSAFYRAFRRETGVTPKQYRAEGKE